MENIKFDEKGLIPAVVQDITSGEVLMVAYMNEESLELSKTKVEGAIVGKALYTGNVELKSILGKIK